MKKRLRIYLSLSIIFGLGLVYAGEEIEELEERALSAGKAPLQITVENPREFDSLEISAPHHQDGTHVDIKFLLEWRHVLRLPTIVAAFPNLRGFLIATFPDMPEQFHKLLSAFRNKECLTSFGLVRSVLRKPLLSAFIKSIGHFHELSDLRFDSSEITSRGARQLVRAIKNNNALPKLKSLSLEGNKISFAGVKYLLRFFKTKEDFESLSILGNPLLFEQAEGLTAYIKEQDINFTVLYPYLRADVLYL